MAKPTRPMPPEAEINAIVGQEIYPQFSKVTNEESEQPIAVEVGVPTRERAEEIPQHALHRTSRSHRFSRLTTMFTSSGRRPTDS